MKIRMSLEGDRFLARESILLRVGLENTSTAMLEIPDPEDVRNPQFSYTITGPAYPLGLTFQPRISLPNPNAPATLKMGPGEKLEAQLPLNLMFRFSEAGTYTLTAHYEWSGQREDFGPISFAIETGTLKSARIMADDGLQSAARVRVLGLAGDPPRLYQFFFQEARPAETHMIEMIRAATAAPNAGQALAPWTNFDRSELLFARFGWQGTGEIGFETGLRAKGSTMAAPLDSTVIHPALMTEDGSITVFTHTPASVSMASFPAPVKGGVTSAGRVQRTRPTPEPTRAAAAALGPRPQNLVCAITVSENDRGVKVTRFDGDGDHGAPAAEVENARILPNSEPALWVDSRGGITAAILLAENSLYRRVFLAEVVWNDVNDSPKVTRRTPIELPRDSRASAVTFSVTQTRPPRMNWVILMEDGSLLTDRSPSAPYHPLRRPLLPLQLLGMSSSTYLLVESPEDYLAFEAIH